MKKYLPVVLLGATLLAGAGCSSQPVVVVDDNVDIAPVQEQKSVQNNSLPTQKIMPNSQQEKIQSVDAQIASLKVSTFALPIANASITKRELSGALTADNTGKVMMTTEGMATVKDTYYFDKGVLVAALSETTAAGETNKKEMYFENKKAVSFLSNGVDDMKNKNLQYLEEQNLSGSESALNDFVMKKQVSGE